MEWNVSANIHHFYCKYIWQDLISYWSLQCSDLLLTSHLSEFCIDRRRNWCIMNILCCKPDLQCRTICNLTNMCKRNLLHFFSSKNGRIYMTTKTYCVIKSFVLCIHTLRRTCTRCECRRVLVVRWVCTMLWKQREIDVHKCL